MFFYVGFPYDHNVKAVRRAVYERGLTSHMNDHKWRALCSAVVEQLPFAPPYQEKRVTSDVLRPEVLEFAPGYHGDWARTPEGAMGLSIEWLKVAPRVRVEVGRLLPPRIEDCAAQLRGLLTGLRIPFKEEDGFFVVFGHTPAAEDLFGS